MSGTVRIPYLSSVCLIDAAFTGPASGSVRSAGMFFRGRALMLNWAPSTNGTVRALATTDGVDEDDLPLVRDQGLAEHPAKPGPCPA